MEEARVHSATLERNNKDSERRASKAEASFAKQLRTVRKTALVRCFEIEESLRERYGLRV